MNQEYAITILTPTHIGSGDVLLKGLDFFSRNNETVIVDFEELSRVCGNRPEVLSELSTIDPQQRPIDRILQKYNLLNQLTRARRYELQIAESEIRRQLMDGWGKPIIPGSSIKGAIRTALLWYYLKNTNQRRELLRNIIPPANERINERTADDRLLARIFGNDSYTDLMRVVQTDDAIFELTDLQLIPIRILSQRQNGPYWKLSLVAEGLKLSARSKVTLTLDNFLLSNSAATQQLHFPNQPPQSIPNLEQVLRDWTNHLIESEIRFFDKLDFAPVDNVKKVYEKLNERNNQLTNGFILRVGWGGGWKAMTGDYIPENDEIMREIRIKFRLGTPGFSFPKSRRIAFVNNNVPYPMGYIQFQRLG